MPLVCFASPKGGVGKTVLTANVAGELARAGQRVIALDLDPQNALRLHFGIPLQDAAGFTRLLLRRPDWRPLLRRTASGVGLLAYGQTDSAHAVALSVELSRHPDLLIVPIREMLSNTDTLVIVDTMPGPSPHLTALLPMTDLLITVLHADAASIALLPFIEGGTSYGMLPGAAGKSDPNGRMCFVINQYDPRTRLGPRIVKSATRHLGVKLLGTVYRDETVGETVAAQKLLADYAPACKAAQDIAALSQEIVHRLQTQTDRTVSERRAP